MTGNFGLVAAGSAGICQTKVPTPLSKSQWGYAEADKVRQFLYPNFKHRSSYIKNRCYNICSANVGVCIN